MSKINSMRLQLLLRDMGYFLVGVLAIAIIIGTFIMAVQSGIWPILVVALLGLWLFCLAGGG